MTMNYQPFAPESGKVTQLKIAAIILLVISILSWLLILIDLGGRAILLARGMVVPPPGATAQVQTGFYIGFWVFFIGEAVALLMLPMLAFGAIQMLRRRMYGFCRVTAIMAIVPISAFCCCLGITPLGIWMLVLLNSAEVKEAFS